MNDPALLDSFGAAQFLGTTPRTLRRWIERGLDIPLIRVSSRVLRFDPVDLRAWTEARKQASVQALKLAAAQANKTSLRPPGSGSQTS